MSRPVARAGVTAAILCGLTGLCLLEVPAFLPSWHVAWLVKPLIGIEVRPLLAEYFGLDSETGLAVAVAIGGIGLGATAFYLDHCVISQPMWAVVGGWGLLLGGLVTATLQEVVNASRTTFVDTDHLLWPLGVVPVVIGATVILVSWWRAPEFFSPHLSRWTVLGLVPAIAIIAVAKQTGLAQTATLALIAVVVLVALTAGEWPAGRSSAESVASPTRPDLDRV